MDEKTRLRNKKILVTGGNGYLGRNLIKKLVQFDAKVFCVDIQKQSASKNISYYSVDLRNNEEIKKTIQSIRPQIIYHLAASLNRIRDFKITNDIFEVNVKGTVNLLNALADINYENFIYTSTSEVYGGKQIKSPFKENSDFIPASPYALSKYTAETAIKTYSEIYDRNYTILRLFNFYGEGMPSGFFIPQLVEKLKKNENFNMTAGEQIRDFLHVNDVIDLMVKSTYTAAYKKTMNVCSGEGKTLKEIALKLKESLKSSSKINFGALPYRENEIWEMVGDNTLIKNIFNFSPKFNLFF